MTTGRINQVSRLRFSSPEYCVSSPPEPSNRRFFDSVAQCNQSIFDFPTSVYLNSGRATRRNRTENEVHQDTKQVLGWVARALKHAPTQRRVKFSVNFSLNSSNFYLLAIGNELFFEQAPTAVLRNASYSAPSQPVQRSKRRNERLHKQTIFTTVGSPSHQLAVTACAVLACACCALFPSDFSSPHRPRANFYCGSGFAISLLYYVLLNKNFSRTVHGGGFHFEKILSPGRFPDKVQRS